MPMPFNAPSPVLFQLLDWLTGAAKGVVSTAEERIADASNQMPVGTALALIEQGSITYSAIHMRLHNSMAKLLEIVCRINYDILDDEEVREELGEEIIYREDFNCSTDIIPVSDPNIFSESQRYAQIQAVMQLMEVGKAAGVAYNVQEVHRRALELMKVNDIEGILPIKPKATEMNALAENVSTMLGNEIMVFPTQDHLSHIETHLRFVNDPNFGGSGAVAGRVLPQILDHVSQHMAFLYADSCNTIANDSVPAGVEAVNPKEMDQLLAAVSAKVAATSQVILQPIQEMLQQAQDSLAKLQPPPPKDPAQVQEAIGMAEIDRQKQRDQQEAIAKQNEQQLKQQADQYKQQAEQFKQELAAQKLQLDAEKDIEKLRQEAEKTKASATDMLQKAMLAQQKLQLDQEKFELDRAKAMAEHELKVAEATQKQMEAFAQQEDSRVQQIMAEHQAIIEKLTQVEEQPKETGALEAVLEQLSKPKVINVLRDARGRAISFTQE
jgi:flagellar biosynthesis GTPase FlhF